ncbi:hypothetical protein BKA69DRAFT_1170253 [Paraphysoderma sedebokerense]|nr:hypothetical protein BKA69DRAFT_1170253 [Paraphysoderma sedebokerense]
MPQKTLPVANAYRATLFLCKMIFCLSFCSWVVHSQQVSPVIHAEGGNLGISVTNGSNITIKASPGKVLLQETIQTTSINPSNACTTTFTLTEKSMLAAYTHGIMMTDGLNGGGCALTIGFDNETHTYVAHTLKEGIESYSTAWIPSHTFRMVELDPGQHMVAIQFRTTVDGASCRMNWSSFKGYSTVIIG